jgi:hypothetical protein
MSQLFALNAGPNSKRKRILVLMGLMFLALC